MGFVAMTRCHTRYHNHGWVYTWGASPFSYLVSWASSFSDTQTHPHCRLVCLKMEFMIFRFIISLWPCEKYGKSWWRIGFWGYPILSHTHHTDWENFRNLIARRHWCPRWNEAMCGGRLWISGWEISRGSADTLKGWGRVKTDGGNPSVGWWLVSSDVFNRNMLMVCLVNLAFFGRFLLCWLLPNFTGGSTHTKMKNHQLWLQKHTILG